jgi:exodeoxyribonuclease V alpha subunit
VLLDLLDSERVPVAKLTRIFRQAEDSLLVVNANRVKDGQEPFWSKAEAERALGRPVKDDWRFVEVADDADALAATLEQVERTAAELAIRETDVLVTAPSRKAKVGVYQLNRVLQDKHNPHGEEVRGGDLEPLRVGDVVMNTQNRYSPFRGSDRYHDVMNGDMGRLVEWDKERKVAWVDFGEEQGPQPFTRDELAALSPAFAATTHKLQGSEAAAIVAPLAPGAEASGRLSRELIYTAWTRAKQRCVVIGSKATIRQAIARGAAAERETTLDLRVGRIAPRLKSRLEQLREIERRWQNYAASEKVPRLRRARGGGVAREQVAA